jgi:hypothetical protein
MIDLNVFQKWIFAQSSCAAGACFTLVRQVSASQPPHSRSDRKPQHFPIADFAWFQEASQKCFLNEIQLCTSLRPCPVTFPAPLMRFLSHSHRIAHKSLEVIAVTNLALWCTAYITGDCDKQSQFRLSLWLSGKAGLPGQIRHFTITICPFMKFWEGGWWSTNISPQDRDYRTTRS